MEWIDYKKAYDVVLQSWIINCLRMYKVSDEVINFIEKTVKTWRVELTAGVNEDPERYISGRCSITITNCNSDDAIQPDTQEIHWRIKTL